MVLKTKGIPIGAAVDQVPTIAEAAIAVAAALAANAVITIQPNELDGLSSCRWNVCSRELLHARKLNGRPYGPWRCNEWL